VTALYEITPPGGPVSVDPLRYGAEKPASAAGGGGEEIAFLRYRYKRPGGETSVERSAPITEAAAHASLAAAPEPTRWALASPPTDSC
jgi:Ca-activated chloride channel family protein